MSDPITPLAFLLKALPGAVGALVSLKFLKIDGTINKITTVLGGFATSFYATEPVATYLNVALEPVSFGLGLLGMGLLAKVFEVLQNINAQGLASWLQGFLPTKKGGE